VSDLVALAYPDLATAQQVATNLGAASKAGLVEIDDPEAALRDALARPRQPA
jgi:uncharacterized membrane protein